MEVFDIDILLNERIAQERAEHVLPHLADEACGYTEARGLHGDVCRCAAGILLKNRDAGRRFACGGKIDQKFTECVKIVLLRGHRGQGCRQPAHPAGVHLAYRTFHAGTHKS